MENYLDLVMEDQMHKGDMERASRSISSLVMMIFTENGDLFMTLKTIALIDVLITGRLIFLLV